MNLGLGSPWGAEGGSNEAKWTSRFERIQGLGRTEKWGCEQKIASTIVMSFNSNGNVQNKRKMLLAGIPHPKPHPGEYNDDVIKKVLRAQGTTAGPGMTSWTASCNTTNNVGLSSLFLRGRTRF